MQFTAKAKYIKYSPYKLRPLANVIRGKSIIFALNWLQTYGTRRSVPLSKVLQSALANAKDLGNTDANSLTVESICVDQGPIIKYYKPGAMGRAMTQRKRQSHISVILKDSTNKI